LEACGEVRDEPVIKHDMSRRERSGLQKRRGRERDVPSQDKDGESAVGGSALPEEAEKAAE
jgi:hypothetical protein